MSNDFTQVSLGERIIEIQNNRYYNPESVQVNPQAALIMSGASILLPATFLGLFDFFATTCIGDGPVGHTIGLIFGAIPIYTTFHNIDPQVIYDSNRFALDAAGSVIGECLGFEETVNADA